MLNCICHYPLEQGLQIYNWWWTWWLEGAVIVPAEEINEVYGKVA